MIVKTCFKLSWQRLDKLSQDILFAITNLDDIWRNIAKQKWHMARFNDKWMEVILY